MLELPFPGEDHDQAVLVGRGDDLLVADRSARLDDRGHPGGGDRVEAVPEREEGVAGRRPALGPAGGPGRGDLARA